MSKVLERIQQQEAELAAAMAEKAEAQQKMNEVLLATAMAETHALFGEMADELQPLLYSRKAYIENGDLCRVDLWLGSEMLQLAPACIEWLPKHRTRSGANKINVQVIDGGCNQSWHGVTPIQFEESILLAMRLAYGPWKAGQEKLEAQEIEKAQKAVMVRRSQLCHPNNWHAGNSEELSQIAIWN